MTKYRPLTLVELDHFKDDFVQYLVVNGIAADDWTKLLEYEREKAKQIIDLFSDVIFEKVLRATKFLEFRSKKYVQGIQCLADKMIMIAISSIDDLVDMRANDAAGWKIDGLQVHMGEYTYTRDRELELFKLTEKGHQISEGELYKWLLMATV